MPEIRRKAFLLPNQLTGHPLRSVCFDIPDTPEYRQAFWGHVWELGTNLVWQKDHIADTRDMTAAAYWREILNVNMNRWFDDDNCSDVGNCRTYPPSAGFIQWFPNDPFLTPDFVGDGYNNPAWYLATTASNIAYGSSSGDAITSLDRFPPGSLPTVIPASGLPRFRINVSGAGTVKATLVNLFGGSLIQTTTDDDILTLKFVDVSRDTVSAPPETQEELTVEFTFDTPGAHHVDFIVVSWVNTSIPFLHHGGGLRRVELCGFETMPVVTPPFRFTEGCGLEFYNGEEWLPVDGWSEFAPECFTGPAGADGADGIDGTNGTNGTDGADGIDGTNGTNGTNGSDAPATIVRSNPAGFGNLQQNIGGAGYTDIAVSDFLRRDGLYEMVGGLEIRGTTDEVKLIVQGAYDVANPIQTNKLVSFRDAAGTEKVWVNPNGSAHFRGLAGSQTLTLDGGIGFDANQRLFWKNNSGVYTQAMYGNSNITVIKGLGTGVQILTTGFSVLANFLDTGAITFQNQTPTTGKTTARIKGGAGNVAADQLFLVDTNNSDVLFNLLYTGAARHVFRDAGTNDVALAMSIERDSTATPAAGFGVGVRLKAKSTTTVGRDQARLHSKWVEATDATRKAEVVLSAYDTLEREVLHGAASGSAPMLAVLGATPAARVNVGTIDCAGNAAAKAALDNLKLFGWIAGTINLGTGETVDPLVDRCKRASRAVHFVLDRYFEASDIAVNHSTFFDYTLELAYRYEQYFTDFQHLIDWADTVIVPAITPVTLGAHQTAVSDAYITIRNALFCRLDNDGCLSANAYDLFKLDIGYVSSDLEIFSDFLSSFGVQGFAMMMGSGYSAYCDDGLDCIDIEDCGALPDEEWSHAENWVTDDWSGVNQTVGGWTFGSGYHGIGVGNDIVIEIPYSILTIVVTIAIAESVPGTPAFPTIEITDLATSVTTFYHPTTYSTEDYSWTATVLPEGSAGVRISLINTPDVSGGFFGAVVTGYGTEVPN